MFHLKHENWTAARKTGSGFIAVQYIDIIVRYVSGQSLTNHGIGSDSEWVRAVSLTDLKDYFSDMYAAFHQTVCFNDINPR